MAKVLGLDAGTNSLGWAIVEETETGYILEDKGVHIFQAIRTTKNRPYRIVPTHEPCVVAISGAV